MLAELPMVNDERIRQLTEGLFAEVHYWPRGFYFRSRAHKDFMLDFRHHVRPGGRCLDLGCGSQTRYRAFIESHGLEWYGADVMDLDQADPHYRPVLDNRIAFEDGLFDAVCTYNVIEHFTQPEEMFAEISRVLKPGGILCGACAFWEMEHASFFHLSHRGLSELLRRHGFERVSLTPSEYSGLILVAQRFFGGNGRIGVGSGKERLRSTVLCNVNWVPFLIINALEFLRKRLARGPWTPLSDCATLYFYARKATALPGSEAHE